MTLANEWYVVGSLWALKWHDVGSLWALKWHDVGSLWAFGGILDGELDECSLFQVAESFALDGGVVHKHILGGFVSVGDNEPIALDATEPLDSPSGSDRHWFVPPCVDTSTSAPVSRCV